MLVGGLMIIAKDKEHIRELIFKQNILANDIDVSNVTDMNCLFFDQNNFNQPLDSWDVSNVTNMRAMFFSCYSFNQPLDSWDVSKVTDMTWMFFGCTNFNQPLNYWDVSNLKNVWWMFDKSPLEYLGDIRKLHKQKLNELLA